MNQYTRQGRKPAASTALPADIAAEIEELPATVALRDGVLLAVLPDPSPASSSSTES